MLAGKCQTISARVPRFNRLNVGDVMSQSASVRPTDGSSRDNDAKYSAQFDEVLQSSGTKVNRYTPFSPNLRGHVERFIRTLKFERLNKFVILAEMHLDYVCRVWSRHHNGERTHSSRDYLPAEFTSPPAEVDVVRLIDIVCTSKLGGAINSYLRRAA